MKPIGHKMILASAGSGKTYALTNRFVQLLAAGAAPERIVALTFTRKAAGEFFDEILNKLARAASDDANARRLAEEIREPQLGPADFLRLLRAVCDAMHRLNLGTLDSFFARIARNFPLELGLSGDFAILDSYGARLERRRVQQRLFLRGGAAEGARREFIEAFKRATFGAEEKRLGSRLDEFLDAYQEIFLTVPQADRWGNEERIWPTGCTWLATTKDRTAAAETLRAALPWAELSEKQRQRWEGFLDGLADWAPGADLADAVEYLLKNSLKAWPELAEITVERKRLALPSAAREALQRLLSAVVGGELTRRLEMTRGLYAVLRGYEAIYHERVRRAGQLTFADVQRLLAPEAGARLLSGEGGAGRLFVDYRLDARYDHWLLDEFQDTSFGQWSVLKNLIDETVQDTASGRSFFYVGDMKQAIFAWREGDPALFREIFDHYNRVAPGTIQEEHLVKSYRSGPAVIEAVNRVFGDRTTIAGLFPAEAADAWSKEWLEHESAKPKLAGQVALLHADDEAGRFAQTLAVLKEIRPLDRGLTCAVLTQKNDTAARLADYLRREGSLPALAEADLAIATDNPLTTALLALVHVAAHPGDTLAWEHVQMTPLHAVLGGEGLESRAAVSQRLLEQIHLEGFERAMEFWLRRLESRLSARDDFSRERGTQFAAAARLFDETGSRNAAEFVRFMGAFTERETEAARVVRVMTVHKSKGLGFDVVLLPELEGKRLDQRRDGLAVQKAADRSVEWVLDLPPKLFHETDEV
ncbi:MAG TPA: UvrD-helicase domain-containing protein, partial [Candidatus Didemnitutus sp.]|nr:UvrD-helicase domain-containing protein [Candidatus Didemnitutus sp.]